ncbi:MAG: Gfo/Idh/MocA family oxidoreductase [Actinobacteria bacterium]|nr:Gfo/Idh/MocA family oxidoreductase [Actinomycetota bacterium]
MGAHHARVLAELPGARLAAVCDADRERGAEVAARYGCAFYDDYGAMLSSVPLDAVTIAVPTRLHVEVACEAMRRGLHVLLEKPLACDEEGAREVVRCARSSGVKLMAGHIERFNPAVTRLKGLIEEGRFGELISLNVRRVGGLPPQVEGADVLLDLAIHDVDVVTYLLDEDPGYWVAFKSRGLLRDQDDNASILMRYGNVTVFIEVNWVTPVKIRTLDITGSLCFGRLDYINQRITLYENAYFKGLHAHRNGGGASYPDFRDFMSKSNLTDEIIVGIDREEPLRRELSSFLRAVREDEDPPLPGEEALRSMEILFGLSASAEAWKNQEVRQHV